MFAMKLTLTVLGALLYLVGTLGWFFWAGPDLVGTGTTEALLYAHRAGPRPQPSPSPSPPP